MFSQFTKVKNDIIDDCQHLKATKWRVSGNGGSEALCDICGKWYKTTLFDSNNKQ